MFNRNKNKKTSAPVVAKKRTGFVEQFGRFLATRKSKRLSRLGLIMLIVTFIAACGDREPKKNCDYDKLQYDDAKETAASDSINFANWKDSIPVILKNMIYQYTQEGMTEEAAWEKTINDAINDPNCPAELKQYALKYKELLDAFGSSVANRGAMYTNWWQCENSDKK